MYPPELITKRLKLKAYTLKDEDRFIQMSLDESSSSFMGGATGIYEEERKLFKKIFEIYERKETRWFWIWGIYKGEVLCGHLELKQTENTCDNELEIVYMVHPDERRQGIITEVLSLIKQHQLVWQRRIIATVSPNNLISIGILKKWGVEKEEMLTDTETGEDYLKLLLSK